MLLTYYCLPLPPARTHAFSEKLFPFIVAFDARFRILLPNVIWSVCVRVSCEAMYYIIIINVFAFLCYFSLFFLEPNRNLWKNVSCPQFHCQMFAAAPSYGAYTLSCHSVYTYIEIVVARGTYKIERITFRRRFSSHERCVCASEWVDSRKTENVFPKIRRRV